MMTPARAVPAHLRAPQGTATLAPPEDRLSTLKVFLFLAAHAPLAMAMRASSLISTAHALAAVGTALFWAVRDRHPNRVIPMMGYIVGAEILWRGTGARIFWETGKYSITVLAIILLVRFGLLRRATKIPFVYFALLLPSLAVLPNFDRQLVASNLSGPLALAISVALFGTLRLSPLTFRYLSIALIAPVLGLAAISSFSTFTASNLQFTGSTKITSAGIGPNQVASTLGLGALFALFYAFVERRKKMLCWMMVIIALWFLGQGTLTFSRGGVANCLGAMAVGSFFLLGDRKTRGGAVVRGALAATVGLYLLFPALDAMTGGNLGRRFTDSSLTGRDKIIQGDLLAFRENPILGIGPGEAWRYHEVFFRQSGSHTEYTRLLAEHGSFGILALLLLIGMSGRPLLSRAPPLTRAFRATMIAWALLYFFHSATRLAAPSFTFGLAAALILVDRAPIRRRESPAQRAPARPVPALGPRPPQSWPSPVPTPHPGAPRP